jgi:deoxyadenosine/deoxycytidine kinase
MGYDSDVIDVVENSLDQLLKRIDARQAPFNSEEIDKYFQIYLLMIRNK